VSFIAVMHCILLEIIEACNFTRISDKGTAPCAMACNIISVYKISWISGRCSDSNFWPM
jgi:hypothetical protein